MVKKDFEDRIRRLETGLDHFDGVQWIIRVGEIARIKSIVLDLSAEASQRCADRIDHQELTRIDKAIEIATTESVPVTLATDAFSEACRSLYLWLSVEAPHNQPA
jgi:hypothetical protein